MYKITRDGKTETPPITEAQRSAYLPTVQQQHFRSNIQNVLAKSTILPFKWLKNAFRCFYCYDIFYEPGHFKNHQRKHSASEIDKAVANHWESTLYVDVSKISCKLCVDTIEDYAHLIDHLTMKHAMPFNRDMANIHPFKLHNLSATCVVCSRSYRSFSSLLTHWNREHRSSSEFLCDICGRSLPNLGDLREHKAKQHKNREVKCNQCNMMCTISTMRTHRQKYHNKMYKCFYCPELFATHYKRNSHLIVVHKNKEAARCPHCPKTFVYRSTMNRHVRECHLQEKNAVCGVCGFRAFGGHRLQRHMMKHSDVRDFQCAACGKAFKTKKTLKQHYLSIHEKGKVPETPAMLALM